MELPITSALQLPLLVPGQAQKEMTHNEALVRIDALLFPRIIAAGDNTPPQNPEVGTAWIIGPQPTGAWLSRAHHLALWTAGGWRFVDLPLGSVLPVGSPRRLWRRAANGWSAPKSVTLATDGEVIDLQSRHALRDLLNSLAEYGLIMAE